MLPADTAPTTGVCRVGIFRGTSLVAVGGGVRCAGVHGDAKRRIYPAHARCRCGSRSNHRSDRSGMWLLQVIVAAVVAALLLTVLRPTLLRRVREAPGYRSALDKLVGSDGVATSDITDGHGQVKVDGEEWSARALEPGSTIAAGEKIEVYEIDGATLVVYPVFRSLSS